MANFILIPGGFQTTAWASSNQFCGSETFYPDPKAIKREKNKLVVLPFLLLCSDPEPDSEVKKARSQIRNTYTKFEPYGLTLLTTMASTMVSGSPLTFSSITIPPMARSFTGWYLPTQHNLSPIYFIIIIIIIIKVIFTTVQQCFEA
jgi:uncharacterized membrane protein YhdT